MNSIIDSLPNIISTAHIIPSANLAHKGDCLHFSSQSMRVLGCRYAEAMLKTMGIDDPIVEFQAEEPNRPVYRDEDGTPAEDFVLDLNYFNPSIFAKGEWDASRQIFTAGSYGFGGWQWEHPIDLSGYRYIVAEIEDAVERCKFSVFDTPNYWSEYYYQYMGEKVQLIVPRDNMTKYVGDEYVLLNPQNIYRIGFWETGGNPIIIKRVYATNSLPVNEDDSLDRVVVDSNDGSELPIYTITGIPVDKSQNLTPGIYIRGSHKILITK